jgi:hypothetical protein
MVETLHAHLSDVTNRIVAQALHPDSSDAPVVDNAAQLALTPGGGGEPGG